MLPVSAAALGTFLFSSISGSHLFGFPSADSDVDLRGVFVAPLREVLSLRPHQETLEVNGHLDGVLVESVFHEVVGSAPLRSH